MNKLLFKDVNPFDNIEFNDWFLKALENSNNTFIDPFAGTNNFVKTLEKQFNIKGQGFDIHPRDSSVKQRDTIKSFPKGYNLVVTNPPYLNKKEAILNKWNVDLSIFDKYDDLLFLSLEVVLNNVDYAAFIMPDFFLKQNKFNKRIYKIIDLEFNMYDQPETKVKLILFNPK